MQRTTSYIIFLIIILAVIAAAVVSTPRSQETQLTRGNVIIDDWGRTVLLPSSPQRIVSLLPSNTEILYAIGAGPRVVGVDKYSDFPPEVTQGVKSGAVTVVGGIADANVEIIMMLQPDLVLAGHLEIQGKIVKNLEDKGLTVVALDPKNIIDLYRTIRTVGKITGNVERADAVAAEMEKKINAVRERVRDLPRVKVYYEVWHDPLISVGPGTWIHDMIELSGGRNIFENSRTSYPQISTEAVIQLNPEVIILTQENQATMGKIIDRPGWSSIQAVRDGKIFYINGNLFNRPGPRIAEGFEELGKIIHPEAFYE